MIVSEMIIHLQTLDPDMPVVGITCGHCEDCVDIDADNMYVTTWVKTRGGEWNGFRRYGDSPQDVLVIR